jgi:dihydroorotate dehydrogenase (NAD+) catalytic subunit
VQVGTASFWEPAATSRIAAELDRFLAEEGISHVSEIIGTLRLERGD